MKISRIARIAYLTYTLMYYKIRKFASEPFIECKAFKDHASDNVFKSCVIS